MAKRVKKKPVEFKALYITREMHNLAKSKASVQGRSLKGYIERLVLTDKET